MSPRGGEGWLPRLLKAHSGGGQDAEIEEDYWYRRIWAFTGRAHDK